MFNYPQSNFQSMPSLGFVHGRQGADMFILLPSSTAYLFDLDTKKFYIKRTDQFGMALPLVECPYTIQDAQNSSQTPQQTNTQDYITRAEFEQFKLAQKGAVNESES